MSVTVDAAGATRPYLGMRVNGELQPIGQTAFAFTLEDGAAAAGFRLDAAFGTNWYVNAAARAGGTGFAPDMAKKTFADLFATKDVLAGDVVHAARGTYDAGVTLPDGCTVGARLDVPDGVTVTADEGPEVTFITGADAPADVAEEHGCGPGAVRCVRLYNSGTVRGFTLTGGRAHSENVMSGGDYYGGGVTGNNHQNCRVVDCVVSNNVAPRGGGAHSVCLVNCRLFENTALVNRAAASNCSLFNCVIDRNRGQNMCQNCYEAYNCTIGADAKLLDGRDTLAYALPSGPVVNCVIMGSYAADTSTPLHATNCLFGTAFKTGTTFNYEGCRAAAADELQFDADWRPVLGANAAVDFGSDEALEALARAGAVTDVHGGQRVYNGRIDAGAAECDWRARYARDIGLRGLTVTAAAPEVTETAGGRVRIAAGALEAEWNVPTPGMKCVFDVWSECGYFAVRVDGAELEPAIVDANTMTYQLVPASGTVRLTFAYTPMMEGAYAYAELGAFVLHGGTLFILR